MRFAVDVLLSLRAPTVVIFKADFALWNLGIVISIFVIGAVFVHERLLTHQLITFSKTGLVLRTAVLIQILLIDRLGRHMTPLRSILLHILKFIWSISISTFDLNSLANLGRV